MHSDIQYIFVLKLDFLYNLGIRGMARLCGFQLFPLPISQFRNQVELELHMHHPSDLLGYYVNTS
jgi:hypothetical protein